jgi:death-on-curing protein
MDFLSAEQILFIHARLIEETGGSHGVRDLDLLLSAIGRPQANFDGQDLYPDLFSKAAAWMESCFGNHPFVDGNKRTGVTVAGIFLRRNGYRLTASNADLVKIAMGVAQSHFSLDEIATWLRENSQTNR